MNGLPSGDLSDLYAMVMRAVLGAAPLVVGAISLRFFIAGVQQILSGNKGGGWESSPVARAIPDVMLGGAVYAGVAGLTAAFWAYAKFVGGK